MRNSLLNLTLGAGYPPYSLAADGLRPRQSQQSSSCHVHVRQRTRHKQALRILHQPTVAHLGKAELALDHAEQMFDLGAHPALGGVGGPLRRRQRPAARPLVVGKVLRLRGLRLDHRPLPVISAIAPHPCLSPMQQLAQHLAVMHMGGGHRRRVDELALAIHADMRLQAEVPVVAFLGRMHLRVARAALVLGRTRRGNNAGIDDGAGGDLDAALKQVGVDGGEQRAAEAMPFKQVAEFAHGGLVRCGFAAQVDAGKLAHGNRFVQRFFHCRVGQVEPVLQAVDAQHAREADGRAAVARFGVVGFDQGAQFRPGHHDVHLGQKCGAPGELGVFVESSVRKGGLFHGRSSLVSIQQILPLFDWMRGLNQSFLS